MMRSDMAMPTFQTRMLKTGAALAGAGLTVAAFGMALAAVAVTRAAAAWARQREVSPAALAAEKLDRARHATLAGAHAWHEYAADSANGHRAHAR